ncbi:hypothetical protein ABPG74_009590 [Tetrahymena malaccensis]
MKYIAKIGFLIFIIASVNCQVTPSLCPNLKTQDTCNQNQSCQWTQTNEFSCSSPINCQTLIEENDCYEKKSNCYWNLPIQAQCAVSGKYCQIDNGKCNDESNCILNPEQPATCTVKGTGFGCQKINDQNTCGKQSECSWVTGFCSNNDDNYCGNFSNDTLCKSSDGCQWQWDIQGQVGSCVILNNICSTQQDETTCGNVKACKWNASSACLDKPNYCDPNNCDTDFCNKTDQVAQNCSPNITKNACQNLKQDQCQQQPNQLCTYVQNVPGSCSNINQCSGYKVQNQCNSQSSCSWSNVYQCAAKSSGGSSTYSTKLISGILVLLLICLAF